MGYVLHGFPSLSGGRIKYAYSNDFFGGVRFSGVYGDGEKTNAINLVPSASELCVRPSKKKIFDKLNIQGEVYGYTKNLFYDATVAHIGNSLYSISGTGEEDIKQLVSNMPCKASIMVEFLSKLYIYSDGRIFSVDRNLEAKEQIPYTPLAYTNVHSTTTDETIHECRTQEPFNILSNRIKISYGVVNGAKSIKLPLSADTDKKIELEQFGKPMDQSKYTILADGTIEFPDRVYSNKDGDLCITYYFKDYKKAGYRNFMEDARLCESYGGTALTGTRLILTGSASYPGEYYVGELLDPLKVCQENYQTLGNAGEHVTGLIKQYGRLIVFTQRSVCSMTYEYSDSNVLFVMKELNNTIGCDMPGSIQLIDNRIVFGNSSKGLFLVDSSEDFGEQNIKPVHANISYNEKLGLLNQNTDDLKKAQALDFDGKYMLVVGDIMYIWDYGKTPFYDNGSYIASQKRLCWYIYDGMRDSYIFPCQRQLMCMQKQEDVLNIYVFDENHKGEKINSVYESPLFDMSSPYLYKIPSEIILDLKGEKDTVVTVTALSDKKPYYEISFCPENFGENSRGAVIKLPRKRTKAFSYRISAVGYYSLSGVSLKYVLDPKIQ